MPVSRFRQVSPSIVALDMHGVFQVAVFLVRHARGLVLVDAGFPGWHYAILAALEALPPPNRITHVVLTHAHVDHIGAAGEVARAAGAEIVCSAVERPFIEGKSLASAATALLPRIVLGANHWLAQRRVPRTEVDRVVKEGDTITDLQVVEVPGHTPGQIALIHPGDGVVLCGDTVFNIRARLGHDPIPGITLDPRLAETSMLRVAELGYADVVPSHGPAILGDAPDRIRHFVANRRS